MLEKQIQLEQTVDEYIKRSVFENEKRDKVIAKLDNLIQNLNKERREIVNHLSFHAKNLKDLIPLVFKENTGK